MKTTHEWDIEQSDEFGDITEHNFADKAQDLPLVTGEIVLVRNVGSDDEGTIDRSWAYVIGGELPKRFSDASGIERDLVPARFHNELRKFLANRSLDFMSSQSAS